ncbi:MAG: chemotaxis protein CheB [Xanthomonadaceae bacterium]|nr:chemotaxis protein CheB [Xanthomonadaceae bacterium]
MPESNAIAVALLYQAGQLGSHLKNALGELGAAVVYEAPPASVDRDALENSGARVVIVNLDADSDTYIDALYDVLDAGDYEVVFNDAQVSSNLQGWDQARWVRHLGSKILRKPENVEPPRPPGAQAVPTPVQKSASVVPVAEKPGPAPSVPAPVAPPPPASVEVPASERTTVKMPLPTELLAEPAPEKSAPGESATAIDASELAEFAKLLDMPAAEAVAPAATTPAASPIPELGDFAAELDALFAAADTKPAAPPTADKSAAADDLDIALPADFDLAFDEAAPAQSVELDALDIPDDATAASAPSKTQAVDELHDEFPAIFDQLDVAAVPEAKNAEFKPAERPAAQPQSEPLLPLEWSLEGDDTKPVTGKASFGIEKMSAEEFLAPPVDAPAKSAAPPAPEPTFTLELMPIEEAVAPTQHNPDYVHEQRLESGPAKPLKVGTGAGVARVVVLGASIGGPEAVRDFLGALPAGFPVLFVLAQHMGEEFLELMSAQLRKSIALTVRNPSHGERAAHGDVLIVPTTHRLQVDAEGVVTLAHLPEKMPYSPSIDQVLRDAADAFGDKAGAIIFSGMAHDAIEGSQYLKSKGGWIWAQDPDTCVISSMVDGAREAGVVEFLGAPKQLAEKMIAEYGKA